MHVSSTTTVRVAAHSCARSQGIAVSFAPTGMSPARQSNSEGSVVSDLDQPEAASGKWWGVTALPGIATALLPKLTCPVCWPAYTALLSSFGINFVDYTPYLLPTVSVLLVITLWALAFRARRRQGYGPFGLGVMGAAAILVGKFASENDVGVYAGAILLIVASVWNLWPSRRPKHQSPSTTKGVNYDKSTTR